MTCVSIQKTDVSNVFQMWIGLRTESGFLWVLDGIVGGRGGLGDFPWGWGELGGFVRGLLDVFYIGSRRAGAKFGNFGGWGVLRVREGIWEIEKRP
jgi:hypothetical protein